MLRWPFGIRKPPLPGSSPDVSASTASQACPTVPCGTCGVPMPIVAFDQACPRCRSLVPAARGCPGKCGGCEMGKG